MRKKLIVVVLPLLLTCSSPAVAQGDAFPENLRKSMQEVERCREELLGSDTATRTWFAELKRVLATNAAFKEVFSSAIQFEKAVKKREAAYNAFLAKMTATLEQGNNLAYLQGKLLIEWAQKMARLEFFCPEDGEKVIVETWKRLYKGTRRPPRYTLYLETPNLSSSVSIPLRHPCRSGIFFREPKKPSDHDWRAFLLLVSPPC